MEKNVESYEKTAGLQIDKLFGDVVAHVVSTNGNCSPMDAMRAALTKQLGEDYVDDKLTAVLSISYCVMKNFEETIAKCKEKAKKEENK